VRLLGSGHHHDSDHTTIDPKWFQGREAGEPIENPIKPGLLFPPVFDGPNAPTEEEYKSGKVSTHYTPLLFSDLAHTHTLLPHTH
jgi:hypothetical protein